MQIRLAILLGAACCAAQQYTRAQKEQIKKREQYKKQQAAKSRRDYVENRALTTFYLQDPVDSMCLTPSGQFGACDEFSLFVYAARPNAKQHSITALLAPERSANCISHGGGWWPFSSGDELVGRRCGAGGARNWELVPTEGRERFLVTEGNRKYCMLREAAVGGYGFTQTGGRVGGGGARGAGAGVSPAGGGSTRAHNSASMRKCKERKFTALDIVEVGVHDTGFLLMTADRQCFDGSAFRACMEGRDASLLWAVAVRFDGKGNARRSLQLFKRPELCLYTDGKRPGVDRCDKRGARARGWGLLHGALSHDGGGSWLPGFGDSSMCVVRAVDGSAFMAPCKAGRFESIVIDIPGNMAAGSDDIKKLVNQEFEQQRLQREMEERAQQMRR